MPTLNDGLTGTPRRTLLAIAQRHGLALGDRLAKAELVNALTDALLNPTHLKQVVHTLSADERGMLTALLVSDQHRMPQAAFEDWFGPIRPYKPWRAELSLRPWQHPAGPGERPFYLGLIFLDPERHPPCVFIPDDLVPLLHSLAPQPSAPVRENESPGELPPSPADTCYDIAVLLGLLHAQDIRLLRDRWLPLSTLAAWNARCAAPQDLTHVRHERQTTRLRVLHFLAQAAALLGPTLRALKPTPLGWRWLAHTREVQLRALWLAWQCWPGMWRDYQLPGYDTPILNGVTAFQRLLTFLPRLTQAARQAGTATWLETDPFAAEMIRTQPPMVVDGETLPPLHITVLVGFITAFLPYLGVTHVAGEVFRFTSVGAWLLDTTPPPSFSPPDPLLLVPDADEETAPLGIELPHHPNLAHLAQLESLAEWQARNAADYPKGRYSLTPASLNRARGRGMTLEEITGFLQTACGAPLPAAVYSRLRTWDEAGARLRLSRPALLECDAAAVLSQLARTRRFRSYIVRTLSARAVVLDEAHLPAAVGYLRREGYEPRVSLALHVADAAGPAGWNAQAFHVLAGRVYQGVGRFVQLPAPYPADLERDLTNSLPAAVLAAVEEHAVKILNALASALDGWAPHPSPAPGLDPERSRLQIETAIQSGQALQMTYWTAGRGEQTHRIVDPHRLEQRGQTLYLVAYCHQARAERVFRLDRIQALELFEQPDNWAPDYEITSE